MDRLTERAIAAARSEMTEKIGRFSRAQQTREKDLESPFTRLFSGKKIQTEIDEFGTAQQRIQTRLSALDTITDLNFTQGEDSWDLHAYFKGKDIVIRKIVQDGKSRYSVKVDGQTPPDEAFRGLARLYSSAVGVVYEQIADEEAIERIKDEIRRIRNGGPSRTQERPLRERGHGETYVNPNDHLGYFKALGLDSDVFEGLTEEQIQERLKTNWRRSSFEHHPDQGGDAEKFKRANEAFEILSDPSSRKDYITRSGKFKPQK